MAAEPGLINREKVFSPTGGSLILGGNEARMSNKKPKKSPSGLPLDKFFGQWGDLLLKSHAAEDAFRELLAAEKRGLNAADFAPNLLKDPRQARLEPIGEAVCDSFSPELWDTVGNWWPFRMLKIASETGDVEGYKRLLIYFLLELGVKPPEGVLIPFRWPRGRPKETETAHAAWIAKGRPELNWRVLDDLARSCYGDDFRKGQSDAKLRKNLRDKIRGAILRH
jgi:hypothetical protein